MTINVVELDFAGCWGRDAGDFTLTADVDNSAADSGATCGRDGFGRNAEIFPGFTGPGGTLGGGALPTETPACGTGSVGTLIGATGGTGTGVAATGVAATRTGADSALAMGTVLGAFGRGT